jgi:hypothetical protein
MYLNTKLFPRGKRKSLKPDPQKEDLHPEPDVCKAGAALESAGKTVDPAEVDERRAKNNSYKRTLLGISGAATVDDPAVGKDWHGDKEEETEAEEESEAIWPGASAKVNLEESKKSIRKSIAALKTLPKIRGPHSYTDKEVEFLLSKGFSEDDINLGQIKVTKELASEFMDFLKNDMFKSLEAINLYRR